MWKIKLDTVEKCEELVNTCIKYKSKINIDICYGRYLVDGCSILGVMSLIPHEVEVWIPKADKKTTSAFKKDITEVGAWKE